MKGENDEIRVDNIKLPAGDDEAKIIRWLPSGDKYADELHLYESGDMYECTFKVGDQVSIYFDEIKIASLYNEYNFCLIRNQEIVDYTSPIYLHFCFLFDEKYVLTFVNLKFAGV